VHALAATAALLAGCTFAGESRAVISDTRSTSAPTHSPTRATADVAARHRSDPHLTLLPPGCARGQLRLGRPIQEGAGGEDYTIFALRLARGRPCTLWGTPRVRLVTASGKAAPLHITRQWLGPQHVEPVAVTRQLPQWFALAVYRCDVSRPRFSRRMTATLPNGAGTVVSPARIGYCGPRDGPRVLHVGAIGSWVVGRGRRPAPRHVAISMHSSFSPQGLPTWGRADLNGDGHPDLVVVRPAGLVMVRIGSATLRLRLPADATARLQGLTDFTGDGRTDILVGGTALGCGSGYRLCAPLATVVALAQGRLRTVHFSDDQPGWDNGQGDVFAGWVCRPGGPTARVLDQDGRSSYRLTVTRWRVEGLRARAVASTISRGSASYAGLARLTRTRCRGLDRWGWAPERPPVP
jgi:hypothetical protein